MAVELRNILFLVPYPYGVAPSQRYRFEQYLEYLPTVGYNWHISSFFDVSTWEILYRKKQVPWKVIGTTKGLLRRLLLLFRLRKYHLIFIHREAIPFGPPWYEFLLCKVFNKRLIYDFDDAIWIAQSSSANKWAKLLKPTSKTSKICKISMKVCVGNSYLGRFASQYNTDVTVIPTTINTVSEHNTTKQHQNDWGHETVIGWTGSHSTLPYLNLVQPSIAKLEKKYNIKFLVICDQPPSFNLNSLEFIKWEKKSEIENLLQIDIGLMPLPDTEWALGKCGLKALQYMALGIPSLVTGIGANKEIVNHNLDGFHCNTESDWTKYVEILITNPDIRRSMGQQARDKVEKYYSVEANRALFNSLFLIDKSL